MNGENRLAVALANGVAGWRRGAGCVLDLVLPPRCYACGELVDVQGRLCSVCWPQLTLITAPLCHQCGLPFDFAIAGRQLCAACLARPPAFDRARAAFVYDALSRRLILAFKHGDRTDMARGLGQWLARAAAGLAAEADIIVPVPLHWRRLWRRRYNQSALLAEALARQVSRPLWRDALIRLRATPSQGGLSARQRRDNVRAAFAVAERSRSWLAGKRVLLVDDVFTTGATAEACAKALRRAGACGIDLVTLARVVRPSDVAL
ncbi:MAG: ComF family protein [Pseudomonadota bacterium]